MSLHTMSHSLPVLCSNVKAMETEVKKKWGGGVPSCQETGFLNYYYYYKGQVLNGWSSEGPQSSFLLLVQPLQLPLSKHSWYKPLMLFS